MARDCQALNCSMPLAYRRREHDRASGRELANSVYLADLPLYDDEIRSVEGPGAKA